MAGLSLVFWKRVSLGAALLLLGAATSAAPFVPEAFSVPQRVITPGDEGHGGVSVRGGKRCELLSVCLGGFCAGKFSGGQGPVVGSEKGKLGEHRRQ